MSSRKEILSCIDKAERSWHGPLTESHDEVIDEPAVIDSEVDHIALNTHSLGLMCRRNTMLDRDGTRILPHARSNSHASPSHMSERNRGFLDKLRHHCSGDMMNQRRKLRTWSKTPS